MEVTALTWFMRSGDSNSKCFPTSLKTGGSLWLFIVRSCNLCSCQRGPTHFWFVLENKCWNLRDMTNTLCWSPTQLQMFSFQLAEQLKIAVFFGDKIIWCFFLHFPDQVPALIPGPDPELVQKQSRRSTWSTPSSIRRSTSQSHWKTSIWGEVYERLI